MPDYSDPKIESILRKHAQGTGFNAWLDVDLIGAGNGQVELRLSTQPAMLQHHGFVHGGIVGALADTACAWAAASVAGDVVTASYTLHLLAPALPPELSAKATVVKAGRRNVAVDAKVYCCDPESGEQRIVATALSSIAVLGAAS